VEELVPRVRSWVDRHRDARRIRVLTVLPPGRWRDDLRRLSDAFPRARIELYVPPAGEAEAGETHTPAVVVRNVPGGARGWLQTAARIAFSRPAPTLLICGERSREARLLSRLWPLSPTLIAGTMDQFVLALGQAEAGSAAL
jgi:hypothetical protein